MATRSIRNTNAEVKCNISILCFYIGTVFFHVWVQYSRREVSLGYLYCELPLYCHRCRCYLLGVFLQLLHFLLPLESYYSIFVFLNVATVRQQSCCIFAKNIYYVVVGDVVLAGNFNLEKLFFPEKTFNILTKVASRRMLCLGKLFLKKLFFS